MRVVEANVRNSIRQDIERDDGGYVGNAPKLEVVFDEVPDSDEFIWRRYGTDESDKFVWVGVHPDHNYLRKWYMWYDRERKKQNGFGGRTFTLQTEDGAVDVKGPWATSPAVFDRYKLPYDGPVMSLSFKEEGDRMFYSGMGMAGPALATPLAKASNDLPGNWHYVGIKNGDIWDIGIIKAQSHRGEAPFFVPKWPESGKIGVSDLTDAQAGFIEG